MAPVPSRRCDRNVTGSPRVRSAPMPPHVTLREVREDDLTILLRAPVRSRGEPDGERRCATFLTELEERPLFAHVAAHNVGSIRVLDKCGFANLGRVVVANEETEFLFRLER